MGVVQLRRPVSPRLRRDRRRLIIPTYRDDGPSGYRSRQGQNVCDGNLLHKETMCKPRSPSASPEVLETRHIERPPGLTSKLRSQTALTHERGGCARGRLMPRRIPMRFVRVERWEAPARMSLLVLMAACSTPPRMAPVNCERPLRRWGHYAESSTVTAGATGANDCSPIRRHPTQAAPQG